MYLVCSHLNLCAPNPRPDERLLAKLGTIKLENKDVELNIALHAFVVLDADGVR
ncbi:unnamed protein product, partial [Gongylonema pulchrum]|uniref:AraC family transcriptional regulator n=1 Tax=Gongylonema pulchrum TaxID=637853 RepID=A0A183EVF5_9BILA